ncbi:hypothetical protein [Streptomyces sp. NPDC054783]
MVELVITLLSTADRPAGERGGLLNRRLNRRRVKDTLLLGRTEPLGAA